MRLLLAAFLATSFSAFANDIIKVTDGSKAYCQTKADVVRYQSSGVYRPLKFERTNESAKLTVEFLRCVQRGENFLFVREENLENRTITVGPGPLSRESSTLTIERSDVTAVAFSSESRVYSRSTLKKNADNTYSQSIPMEQSDFETNRDGEKFFELSVSYLVIVTDQNVGRVLDQKLEYLGTYRVFVR